VLWSKLAASREFCCEHTIIELGYAAGDRHISEQANTLLLPHTYACMQKPLAIHS
jgi:hypothetical protein